MKRFRLVITVALEDEIDREWFRLKGLPVVRIRGLEAGMLSGLKRTEKDILIIITGPGPDASLKAAEWISDHLSPLSVLNIGTCGLSGDSRLRGRWITPEFLRTPEGAKIQNFHPLPVPEPEGMITLRELVSMPRPVTDGSLTEGLACDMEAYYQAEVFRERGIPFRTLKFITDSAGPSAKKEYREALPLLRQAVRDLFGFLDQRPDGGDISVIIPVHNRPEPVMKAVDSVLSQSLKPLEVIVVDDGSTDQTPSVLKRYGSRITLLQTGGNHGPSRARNMGVAAASGRWVAFLDSDDLWKEDKLRKQVEYLERNPFFEIIQSGEIWIRHGRRVNPCKHHQKEEGWIWERSLNLCLISPSSVMLKKSLFEKYGGFREDLPVCEDYDLWIRITREHLVGLVPDNSVVKYGGHPDQLSRRYPAMDRFRVRSLHDAWLAERSPQLRQRLQEVLIRKANILLGGYRKRGKVKEVREMESLITEITKKCAS